ncbi:MAG: hypothetical protein V2J24_08845, partial [Pseudomonadales bacterium]|nr:hypothetical protein [Pseudomonadales bacterium]
MSPLCRNWILLLALLLPIAALARAPDVVEAGAGDEELDAAIALLEDDARRDALLEELRLLRAARASITEEAPLEPTLGALLL